MKVLQGIKANRVVKEIIRQPFTFPGGYEKALTCDDGGILCHKCTKENYNEIAHDTVKGWNNTGWNVTGIFTL